MNLFEAIKEKKEKVSIVGLGYVGMPLTIAFAKAVDVIAFDISKQKVMQYLEGIDVTKEVGNEAIKKTTAQLTWEEKHLKDAKFHIVAVPTPVNDDHTPDLNIFLRRFLALNLLYFFLLIKLLKGTPK